MENWCFLGIPWTYVDILKHVLNFTTFVLFDILNISCNWSFNLNYKHNTMWTFSNFLFFYDNQLGAFDRVTGPRVWRRDFPFSKVGEVRPAHQSHQYVNWVELNGVPILIPLTLSHHKSKIIREWDLESQRQHNLLILGWEPFYILLA